MKLKMLFIFGLIVITTYSCGESQIDFSETIEKNGIVYKTNSDTPYSGVVVKKNKLKKLYQKRKKVKPPEGLFGFIIGETFEDINDEFQLISTANLINNNISYKKCIKSRGGIRDFILSKDSLMGKPSQSGT